MSDFRRLEFLPKSGAWLLLVNVALLCVNAVLAVQNSKPPLPVQQPTVHASKSAAHLGMDVGYVKDSLCLFIDKDFPEKNNFELTDRSQWMVVRGEGSAKDAHAGATRSVAIALGLDFDFTCFYSLDKGVRVNELQLTVNDKIYLDMNADGFFDERVLLSEKTSADDLSVAISTIQIWHESQWLDVTRKGEWSKYRRNLREGGVVEFDMEKGCWLSPTGASDDGSP